MGSQTSRKRIYKYMVNIDQSQDKIELYHSVIIVANFQAKSYLYGSEKAFDSVNL